jgi:hypothetical protein
VDERQHFDRFKDLHKQGMALAQVDNPNFTHSNGRSSSRKMQEVLHLPESLPAKQQWRDRLRSWWYRFAREWEPVTVNKSVDSITMPKWFVIAILTGAIGYGIQSSWRSADQRDMMIEMKTELRLAKEAAMAESAERKADSAEAKAWREVMNGNQKKIEGMLTQQQLDALERIKKAGGNQQ